MKSKKTEIKSKVISLFESESNQDALDNALVKTLEDIKDQIENHLDPSTNAKKNKNGNTKRKGGPL